MQLLAYQHTQFPAAFPLNADDRHQLNEAMNNESALSNYPKRLQMENSNVYDVNFTGEFKGLKE